MKMKILNISFLLLMFLSINVNVLSAADSPWHEQLINTECSGDPISVASVDSGDTVFFDMSAAVYTAGHVYFPVYFNSDDLIYSFDYSFKFNNNRLVFDTIILAPAAGGLLAFSYLNPNDSILRFTSSDLTSISNQLHLAYVHFDFVPGVTNYLDSTDLYTLKAYLNGDACTKYIIAPITVGLNDDIKLALGLEVFPNPANNVFVVKAKEDLSLDIYTISGRCVRKNIMLSSMETNSVQVSDLPRGSYLLHFIGKEKSAVQKLILVD